jgi:hypothetical protein
MANFTRILACKCLKTTYFQAYGVRDGCKIRADVVSDLADCSRKERIYGSEVS